MFQMKSHTGDHVICHHIAFYTSFNVLFLLNVCASPNFFKRLLGPIQSKELLVKQRAQVCRCHCNPERRDLGLSVQARSAIERQPTWAVLVIEFEVIFSHPQPSWWCSARMVKVKNLIEDDCCGSASKSRKRGHFTIATRPHFSHR